MTAARLARLVAVRRLERERRQILVEETTARLTTLRTEHGQIMGRVDESREATRGALLRGVDAAEVALQGDLEAGLLVLARRRRIDAELAAVELAERRVAVRDARREERKLERLGERLELRRREEELRRQEREIDDRVAARWSGLRMAGRDGPDPGTTSSVGGERGPDLMRGGYDDGRA